MDGAENLVLADKIREASKLSDDELKLKIRGLDDAELVSWFTYSLVPSIMLECVFRACMSEWLVRASEVRHEVGNLDLATLRRRYKESNGPEKTACRYLLRQEVLRPRYVSPSVQKDVFKRRMYTASGILEDMGVIDEAKRRMEEDKRKAEEERRVRVAKWKQQLMPLNLKDLVSYYRQANGDDERVACRAIWRERAEASFAATLQTLSDIELKVLYGKSEGLMRTACRLALYKRGYKDYNSRRDTADNDMRYGR